MSTWWFVFPSLLIFSSSSQTHLCFNQRCKSAASLQVSHQQPFPSSDLMKVCVGTLISRWITLTGHRPQAKLSVTLDLSVAGRGVRKKRCRPHTEPASSRRFSWRCSLCLVLPASVFAPSILSSWAQMCWTWVSPHRAKPPFRPMLLYTDIHSKKKNKKQESEWRGGLSSLPTRMKNDGRGSCNLEKIDEIWETVRDDGQLEGRDEQRW